MPSRVGALSDLHNRLVMGGAKAYRCGLCSGQQRRQPVDPARLPAIETTGLGLKRPPDWSGDGHPAVQTESWRWDR
jgi:hypothetical protein